MPKDCKLDIIKKNKKKSLKRCQDLPEKEKERLHQYDCKQYKDLTEDEKQRLIKYRKNKKHGEIKQ